MMERGNMLEISPTKEEELLAKTFFRSKGKEENAGEKPEKKGKPTHYKVCCISLYNEDIEHLENLVATLKKRGCTKANKSQVIRYALATADIDKMPKGY